MTAALVLLVILIPALAAFVYGQINSRKVRELDKSLVEFLMIDRATREDEMFLKGDVQISTHSDAVNRAIDILYYDRDLTHEEVEQLVAVAGSLVSGLPDSVLADIEKKIKQRRNPPPPPKVTTIVLIDPCEVEKRKRRQESRSSTKGSYMESYHDDTYYRSGSWISEDGKTRYRTTSDGELRVTHTEQDDT